MKWVLNIIIIFHERKGEANRKQKLITKKKLGMSLNYFLQDNKNKIKNE